MYPLKSNKRILFIHHTPGYGGAYKSLIVYVSVLRDLGHVVQTAFYNSELKGSDFHYRYQGRISFLRRVMQVFYLIKLGRKFKPDLIIGLMPVNAMFSFIVARILRVPVIGSERGDPYSHTSFIEKVKQRVLSNCDFVIFQTLGAQEYYADMLKGHPFLVPNCVEPSIEKIDYSLKCDVVSYFGRFDLRHKRLDILFEVFQRLSKIFPELKFDIYGGGSKEEERFVREKCNDYRLNDKVNICGVTSDIYEEMEKRRFYILTSDSEGMPNSLLEAMACGMVCISTDCSPGGAACIIENGINGYIAPRGDVSALVQYAVEVISNPSLGERLSTNARIRASQFNKMSVQRELESIISRL